MMKTPQYLLLTTYLITQSVPASRVCLPPPPLAPRESRAITRRAMLCAAALVSVAWRPSMVTPAARHLATRSMCARMEQDDAAWAQVTSRPR